MIELRAATPGDLVFIPDIIPNRYEYFLVYPKGHYPVTLDQIHKLYAERFEFTVVYDDKKLIGFGNLYDRETTQHAFIGNLFIHPDYRGQGLGKLLLQYMVKAVFEKYQLQEARLSVFAENEPAVNLYHQLGFREYSQEYRTDPDNNKKLLLHMKLANPLR